MKPKLFLAVFLFLFSTHSICQPINTQDSLALVDFYNATNGPGWLNHTNWLTTAPVNTWFGINSVESGRVTNVYLLNNHLVGHLPESIGNLTALAHLMLMGNELSGTLPSSLGDLPQLEDLELGINLFSGEVPASYGKLGPKSPNYFSNFGFSHNNLSGPLPAFSNCPSSNCYLNFSYNQFNFSSFDSSFHLPLRIDSAQAYLPLIDLGGKLTVAAGGNVNANTYTWYKDGVFVASITGDSTFTPSFPGNYGVSVRNTALPELTLYGQPAGNIRDSLALVDIFNNSGGPNWYKNTNWLSSAPMSIWFGVTVDPYKGTVTALGLGGNNLIGTIPSSIGNLSSLVTLNLGGNQLSGSIPVSVGTMSNLVSLDVSVNRINSIPNGLVAGMTNLQALGIAYNQLTGPIPDLGNNWLQNISLSHNQLSGSLAPLKSCNNIQFLDLGYNQLTDTIPDFLTKYPNLHTLYLNNNFLSGKIPNSLCYLPLEDLWLTRNQFTGPIPDSIGKLSYLGTLFLDSNQLSGPIPASFGNLGQRFGYLYYSIASNRLNFAGMEQLNQPVFQSGVYAPQANLPISLRSDTLFVAAGGPLAKDTFRLYKDGALVATQTGDSAFAIGTTGKYNILATSVVAPGLTLYSDTLDLGLQLPNKTVTYTQTVTGPTDLTEGIFRIVSLTPTPGPNALSGGVTTLESVDDTITLSNGQPYVQRHYDITPTTNAASSQATVTLYFSQSDFDAYNSYVTSHGLAQPLLPVNGTDNGNVRIIQYHGEFAGTAAPANYSQGAELIVPTVAWDAADGWWTVSFPVNGFSGFYLSTIVNPLPLTLLNFTAVAQGSTNLLKWQTTNETGTSKFVVQRSGDGHGFAPIGDVTAANHSGTNSYSFTDGQRLSGDNLYRLQMVDLDGKFTYSPVVVVGSGGTVAGLTAYPNPARDMTSLLFGSSGGAYVVLVYDGGGRCMDRISGTAAAGVNKLDIGLSRYAAGIYTLVIMDREGKRLMKIRKE